MNFFQEIASVLRRRLPPAVRVIFVINVGIALISIPVMLIAPDAYNSFERFFAQTPTLSIERFYFWQFFTYMFLQAPFLSQPFHLIFNMLILWMFGPRIEYRLGTKGFWRFYLIAGIGAGVFDALLSLGLNMNAQFPAYAGVVGASGALMGLMLAYLAYFPNERVLLFGIYPILIKYLIPIFLFLSIFSSNPRDGVSQSTHLGGLIAAYFYLAYHHRTYDITRWRGRDY